MTDWLSSAEWPSSVMLAVLAVAISLLMLRSRRYFRRVSEGAWRSGPATENGAAGPRRTAAMEMGEWEVEMHELARDLTAQLDSKMAVLAQFTRDADRAAARLEAALARAASSAAEEPATGPEPAEAATTPTEAHPPASRQIARWQRRDEVYSLADYGYPAAEISARTGMPLGEVELILNLRGESGGIGPAP